MTREEAIKLIEHISITFVPTDQYGDYDDPQPYEEALDMAIEALTSKGGDAEMNEVIPKTPYMQNSPDNGADLISRQDARKAIRDLKGCSCSISESAYNRGAEDALRIIKALPSADRPTVDKEYLIDLIQEAVYDGEACAKLMNMVDGPTGEWEEMLTNKNFLKCSNCQIAFNKMVVHNDMDGTLILKFCPNCGAKMRKYEGDTK